MYPYSLYTLSTSWKMIPAPESILGRILPFPTPQVRAHTVHRSGIRLAPPDRFCPSATRPLVGVPLLPRMGQAPMAYELPLLVRLRRQPCAHKLEVARMGDRSWEGWPHVEV